MVLSSVEIKKSIIQSILDFSLNIESYRKSGDYSDSQISEMLSIAIEVNNLINLIDKDPERLSASTNYQRINLPITDLKKIQRVLELVFRYNADINSVSIDIGENLSNTNKYLSRGLDYMFANFKLRDFKQSLQRNQQARPRETQRPNPQAQRPRSVQQQRSNQNSQRKSGGGPGFFSFIFFVVVLVGLALFVYNTFFDRHATDVTSLVKQYRSDRQLSSVERPHAEDQLKVSGTKSLLNIFIDLQKDFAAQNQGLDYAVESADSGAAIRDLIEGKISLAVSSKIPSVAERREAADLGRPLADHKIALDSVVFFVSPSNKLEQLTIEDIKKIYSSSELTWNQVALATPYKQPIMRFSLSKDSGTYAFLKDRIMYGDESAKEIIHIYTPEQILEMVAKNEYAIGFCSLSVFMNPSIPNRKAVKIIKISSSADFPGAKPIDIDGELDKELISRGEYPLTRYLYIISAGDLSDAQAKFIDFMRGPDAQGIMPNYGLVGVN